jgi:3'-phosphoadenosine 5'-phosphosulfate sulfotransferase (PAPS reductase)/FAD synthetase
LHRMKPCYHMKEPLYAVYIQTQDPFPEVEEFVTESVKRYG